MATEHRDDFARLYIRDGQAIERPAVAIDGEVRAIKADGQDALHLVVTPPTFTLTVRFGDLIVHQETSKAGTLDFAAEHPGQYEMTFEAAFPYWPLVLVVEAQ